MTQQMDIPALELDGSPDQQSLATEIWKLMRMRGIAYAANRPISLKLSDAAAFFAQRKYNGLDNPEQLAPIIDQALSLSPAVFAREETEVPVEQSEDAEGPLTRTEVVFKTTKAGKAPEVTTVDHHSFKTRLFQGAVAVESPTEEEMVARPSEPSHHLPGPQLPFAAQNGGAVATPAPAPAPAAGTVKPAAPAPAPVAPPAPQPQAKTPAPAQPVAPTPAPAPVTPKPATPAPAPVAAQPATPAPISTGPVPITLAEGVSADLSQPTAELVSGYGDYFASALVKALEDDFRFVHFANDWFLEERTNRYGKSEFRRIREYMADSEGPVSDTEILRDLMGKRTNDNDYQSTRFAINYRLHKEKKDFEFVGVNDERIWTAPGVAQIEPPRHKATEIGTDYKYLEDAALTDPSELQEEDGVKVWRHVLTFYEYENGVLPYDATARQLFPQPLFEDQKSVILRFEALQLDFTYTAELRYPSGSRGGWVGGLEQFFEENLVPGAILVIRQGRRSNHFTIEYAQGDEQNANVLFYDDRRQKFVFRPVVFTCQVNSEDMLTSERYSKINSQKRLEESDRKKTDLVIANAFEYASQRTTQGYYVLLDDLFPVANIERPFSRNYLRQLLTHGNAQFQPDETTPDAFTYKPPTTGVRR